VIQEYLRRYELRTLTTSRKGDDLCGSAGRFSQELEWVRGIDRAEGDCSEKVWLSRLSERGAGLNRPAPREQCKCLGSERRSGVTEVEFLVIVKVRQPRVQKSSEASNEEPAERNQGITSSIQATHGTEYRRSGPQDRRTSGVGITRLRAVRVPSRISGSIPEQVPYSVPPHR